MFCLGSRMGIFCCSSCIEARGWAGIRGRSALLAGGGGGCFPKSLRISPDRRGGGGEGGCEAISRGDRRGSSKGVELLLGILNGLFGTKGVDGAVLDSGLSSVWASIECGRKDCDFGGDSGGSIMRAGVFAE
jgi:hypothetical protein